MAVAGVCSIRRRHPPGRGGLGSAGAVARTLWCESCSLVLRYRLPRHLSYTNGSQLQTTKTHQERGSRVSLVALRSWGAPLKRDRGFIQFKRPHPASSLLAVRNLRIVGNSALRRCKKRDTASPLAIFFREIDTTKPLIRFIFSKEFRGTRSRPEVTG